MKSNICFAKSCLCPLKKVPKKTNIWFISMSLSEFCHVQLPLLSDGH